MGKRLKFKHDGILSMDTIALSNYIRRRFDPSTVATHTIQETRDVSFQILANKADFETNKKAHLKVFYTLTRVVHAGTFSNPIFKNSFIGFPYLDEYYKLNYKICNGERDEIKSHLLNNGYGDSLLLDTGTFLFENAKNTIQNQCEKLFNETGETTDNAGLDLISQYLTKNGPLGLFCMHSPQKYTVNEDLIITKLSINTILELWTKGNLSESIKTPLQKALYGTRGLMSKINQLEQMGKYIIPSQFIEVFGVLVALGINDLNLASWLLKRIIDKPPPLSIKDQVLLFFSLSKFDANDVYEQLVDMYTKVIKRQIASFERRIKHLELKHALILTHALASLPYKKLNSPSLLVNMGPVDLAVLCKHLHALHEPVDHLIGKVTHQSLLYTIDYPSNEYTGTTCKCKIQTLDSENARFETSTSGGGPVHASIRIPSLANM
ncbi:hypothetical protein BdWA1_002284 [Babesia duncani]|uniref:Uncharacterized protein n=1 Tax=Babesia duncani TaxID=323732 RepID=A0AAD9PIZ6_9APIC|nr:hypothetical protein BdWA1_002284 [Babesia duncani]